MKHMLFNFKNQITNKLTLQPSSSQLAKGAKMNMRINKQYYIIRMNQQMVWIELWKLHWWSFHCCQVYESLMLEEPMMNLIWVYNWNKNIFHKKIREESRYGITQGCFLDLKL